MSPAQVGRYWRGSGCRGSVVVSFGLKGGTVSFGAVVVLVTTMNPFDDGLSRTVKILFTVVNSERSMARSSKLPKICCFVCVEVL